MPKLVATEGVGALFKGVTPLWGRQIPYTMVKFGAFENTVQALYKYVMPKPKEECSKSEQLGVSFAAGYIAGVFCAVISQPADNIVSKLNATKGATIGGIVKEMGMVGLFTRGLPLRIVMIGTLTGEKREQLRGRASMAARQSILLLLLVTHRPAVGSVRCLEGRCRPAHLGRLRQEVDCRREHLRLPRPDLHCSSRPSNRSRSAGCSTTVGMLSTIARWKIDA